MTDNLRDPNVLKIRQDGSYGLSANGPEGPVNVTMAYRNPAIRFVLGDKHVTFRLVEGQIDAEYNADDLTEAAQIVVSEVKRLLGQAND